MSIHRFKYNSKELCEEIKYFSEIHKSDKKEHLIEYFNEWKTKNNLLIEKEKSYLLENKYDKDIEDKIFKSIKYYYIKKYNNDKKTNQMKTNESNESKETKRRGTPKYIINNIKLHIKLNIYNKPSDSYNDFEENYNYGNKYKKIYKNHYYQIKLKFDNNIVN